MEAWIEWVRVTIETHQAWAIPIAGLIAFGESLAIVGLFIPATAIMLLLGGLIGAGALEPVPVLVATITGAILGDAVSYVIGRYYGRSIVQGRWMRPHRRSVARARLFFRRWGVLSVFFGRFLGPVRSTIPLVAGVLEMAHGKFQFANVASALLWAPLMLAPGYLASRGAGEIAPLAGSHWVGLFIAGTVASVVVGLLAIRRMGAGVGRRDRTLGTDRAR